MDNVLLNNYLKIRALEPLCFAFLAMSYIWFIKPMRNDWLSMSFLFGVALIPFLSSYYHGDTLKDIGLRLDNFRTSARDVGIFTLIGALIVVNIGFFGEEHWLCRSNLS